MIEEAALVIQVRYNSHESTFLFSKRILFFLPFGGGKAGGGENEVGMVVGLCWEKRTTNVVGYKESGLIWSLLPKKKREFRVRRAH
jgi:hypothetical protein